MTLDYSDIVTEAREEAIKDGDPETCLIWEMADAIDDLTRRLIAAEQFIGSTASRQPVFAALYAAHVANAGQP